MRDHRRVEAFRLADDLVIGVYRDTKSWPAEERFGLTSQVRRAAVSIVSNIVEGCARQSEREYLRFIEVAYGSARELGYQLSLGKRLEMPVSDELLAVADRASTALWSLHRRARLEDG